MSQPVKLSDALILDARLTAEVAERSIAGQIEYWASIGRAVEPLLCGQTALALRKAGDQVPLSEQIQNVESPAGQKRLAEFLAARPFPHFEAAPDMPGHLVRIDEDGTRIIGRFVNREFVATFAATNRRKKAADHETKGIVPKQSPRVTRKRSRRKS